jgi:LSD1 subclass zinc finger protein
MPERFFPCSSCGATLTFAPGTSSLACGHCGATNDIPAADETARAAAVQELDYHAHLEHAADEAPTVERLEVTCDSCGAHSQLGDAATSGHCAFCGVPIVAQAKSVKLIQPRALLPFALDKRRATAAYEKWLASLWFAPSDLKARAFIDDHLRGVYLPHWTYDMHATTRYTGQRGEHYWVTETYTAMVDGRPQVRTRQVRKTRWYPASGTVYNAFDDVLVPASNSLPRDRVDSLTPWDLRELVPFDGAYLAGFVAESYAVTLPQGFAEATVRVQPTIDNSILRDIGGDCQIIHSKDSRYDGITFKHILLPIWLTAYRYSGKTYRVMINAITGELSGERPYSALKITLAVLAGLLCVGVIVALVVASR